MKKIIGLVLFSSLLIGCSNVSSNESAGSASEETTSEVAKSGFDFTSGVDSQNLSYADKDNFINVEGISHKGNDIYLIYNGTVLENIEPNEDGVFAYYNTASEGSLTLIFSDDTNLTIGDTNIDTSDLNNSETITIYPNEEYLAQLSEETENVPANALGLNEAGVVLDGEGNPLYSVTITKATTTLSETDDLYTQGKPENTIEVTYEYKNYSYGSLMEVSSQFISVYGADGMAAENVGMRDGQTEVPDGKSATSTTWYVMPEPVSDLSSIEVSYGGDFSLGFDGYIPFDIPLE